MMDTLSLKKWLDQGHRFGLQLVPENAGCIGWMEIYKRENGYHIGLPSKCGVGDRDLYVVEVCELLESVYNSGKYPGPEDYPVTELHCFESVEDVLFFLKQKQKNINDIKWFSEIKAL